jgi:hypothetical protein
VANAFNVSGVAGELALQVFNLCNDAHREASDMARALRRGDLIDRRVSGSLLVRS